MRKAIKLCTQTQIQIEKVKIVGDNMEYMIYVEESNLDVFPFLLLMKLECILN